MWERHNLCEGCSNSPCREQTQPGWRIERHSTLHLLDVTKLQNVQDFADAMDENCRDLQLVTAQVHQAGALLHPQKQVGEELIGVTSASCWLLRSRLTWVP